MKRISKFVAVAAITLGACGTLSIPAQAATPNTVVAKSKHTGTSGCFNWSWADGTSTTTIYYHNTCSTTKHLCVWWKSGNTDTLHKLTAAGGAKGHRKEDGTIISQDIEDC
jgi:hypothetical protein